MKHTDTAEPFGVPRPVGACLTHRLYYIVRNWKFWGRLSLHSLLDVVLKVSSHSNEQLRTSWRSWSPSSITALTPCFVLCSWSPTTMTDSPSEHLSRSQRTALLCPGVLKGFSVFCPALPLHPVFPRHIQDDTVETLKHRVAEGAQEGSAAIEAPVTRVALGVGRERCGRDRPSSRPFPWLRDPRGVLRVCMWDLASASERHVCVHQCPSCCGHCDELALGSEVEFLPEEPGNEHFPVTVSAWCTGVPVFRAAAWRQLRDDRSE